MGRGCIVYVAIQDVERKAPRMSLVFQVETTDKAPCARVLVEVIRPGDRPGLDSQKIVDWVSEQSTSHSKWAGLHAVTMRNKQIGRGGDWFITHYAVEMANLGTETIAEWRIDFDKGLGQGNVIKAQGSWIDQVAVPVPNINSKRPPSYQCCTSLFIGFSINKPNWYRLNSLARLLNWTGPLL